MSAALLMAALCLPTTEAPKRLTITVTETAGLRRFDYPVEAVLPLPADQVGHCRLLADGKPLVAQFCPGPDGKSVFLDFSTSLGPLEKRQFLVECGSTVTPGPTAANGLRLEQADGVFRVRRGADQVYELPADLSGFLRKARVGGVDYLRPGSVGLVLRDFDNMHTKRREASYRVGGPGTTARVVRSGPLAVAIHFTNRTAIRDGAKLSEIDVTFPASKSWVRVDWTLKRLTDEGSALPGADLNLNVQGEPVLVDFGATSTVYTTLKKGQEVTLSSTFGDLYKRIVTYDWQVRRIAGGKTTLLARSLPLKERHSGEELRGVEGWAHVMDRQRCTAIAMEGFDYLGELAVTGEGRVRFSKPGTDPITFWLHFVPMPVQVGAVTSAQSMMAPLKVEIK